MKAVRINKQNNELPARRPIQRVAANPETGLTPVFAGLKAGDIVITGPLAEITDGAPVQQAETATK